MFLLKLVFLTKEGGLNNTKAHLLKLINEKAKTEERKWKSQDRTVLVASARL